LQWNSLTRPCFRQAEIRETRTGFKAGAAKRFPENEMNEEKVGSFCCPALPVPLDSASVARCGPNRA